MLFFIIGGLLGTLLMGVLVWFIAKSRMREIKNIDTFFANLTREHNERITFLQSEGFLPWEVEYFQGRDIETPVMKVIRSQRKSEYAEVQNSKITYSEFYDSITRKYRRHNWMNNNQFCTYLMRGYFQGITGNYYND